MKKLGDDQKKEREQKVNEYSWAYNQMFLYRPTIEIYWMNIMLKQVLPHYC